VNSAVQTSGLPVGARPVIEPPSTSRSSTVKPVGASLKVKVTSELAVASLSALSAIATVTVGLVRSMVTLSLPEAPRFRAASV
jgi:hypothetical protein